jgi:hypothetical protein
MEKRKVAVIVFILILFICFICFYKLFVKNEAKENWKLESSYNLIWEQDEIIWGNNYPEKVNFFVTSDIQLIYHKMNSSNYYDIELYNDKTKKYILKKRIKIKNELLKDEVGYLIQNYPETRKLHKKELIKDTSWWLLENFDTIVSPIELNDEFTLKIKLKVDNSTRVQRCRVKIFTAPTK